MAVTRTDTLNEELALIMMDAFSILASVGFIMVILIIVLSDYIPEGEKFSWIDYNPVVFFDESNEYSPVQDNATKRMLRDLDIFCDVEDREVKATSSTFLNEQALVDSSKEGALDFSRSRGRIEHLDVGVKENGNIKFKRLILCPEITIDGEVHKQCLVYIPIDRISTGQGRQYAGKWTLEEPSIYLYKKTDGNYSYEFTIIEQDYPIVKLLRTGFISSIKIQGKK